MSGEQAKLDKINERIENGKIIEQKSWKFIKELNSYSEERLNAVALIESENKITYRRMFRKWERYAEVFSALGITEKEHARVGLVAETAASSVFSLYGLNMVGASVSLIGIQDLMDEKRLRKTIEKEALTDLILSDLFMMPDMLLRLTKRKEALGLRHIILIHVPVKGDFIPGAIQAFAKRIRPRSTGRRPGRNRRRRGCGIPQMRNGSSASGSTRSGRTFSTRRLPAYCGTNASPPTTERLFRHWPWV